MVACRPDCSAGSATFTTVLSMKAMLEPRMAAASTHLPRRPADWPGGPASIAASSQGALAMFAMLYNFTLFLTLWTSCTTTDPSPTADATHFTLPERTSTTAKTQGTLVSNRYGCGRIGHFAVCRSCGERSAPVFTNCRSSSATQPLSSALEVPVAPQTYNLRLSAERDVRTLFDSADQINVTRCRQVRCAAPGFARASQCGRERPRPARLSCRLPLSTIS